MNTTEQEPSRPQARAVQPSRQEAVSAFIQITSGILSLLRLSVRVLVSCTAKLFSFSGRTLDRFARREFSSSNLIHRCLRASQKQARSLSHLIGRLRLADLQQASVLTQFVAISAMLVLGYFVLGFVFSSAPPSKIVHAAVAKDVGSTVSLGGGITQNELSQFGLGNKLKKYRITNHYTRKINGEKFHVYDYSAEVGSVSGSSTQEGTVAIVKRGSDWYTR